MNPAASQRGDTMNEHKGRIVRITGPVLDVKFDDHHMPQVYSAMHTTDPDTDAKVWMEVEMQPGRRHGALHRA